MSDDAEVMCGGKLFQKLAPETGNAHLPTAERLNGGTVSLLKEADRQRLVSMQLISLLPYLCVRVPQIKLVVHGARVTLQQIIVSGC